MKRQPQESQATSEVDMSSLSPKVVDEVCDQFAQEGMTLRVVSIDEARSRVEMNLEFENVDCLDCVLPKDYLERLIASSLFKRSDRVVKVLLHDPRVTPTDDVAAIVAITREQTIEVLDPTAPAHEGNPDPGPEVGDLSGKKVLFRVDPLWRSWDWTVEEWTSLLRDAGSTVITWRRWQGIPGDEGARLQTEYEELVGSSDVLISGLANCGSCSAWTIRDALTGLNSGVPSVAVVTQHFVALAKMLALDGHRPGLRILTLPYPLDTLPEEEVRKIARNHFPLLVSSLEASV